jgi:glycosyltransferase involved in cell wall biosynthesis
MPTVSVILPTYNRERFLPDAWASILAQTFTDWELVVVDDGSTDGTRELVSRWSAVTGRKVVYVYQQNRGAYGARNTGLDHASGDFVAFFDSDDLWLPHHLAHSVDALLRNPDVDWLFAPCRCVDANGRIVTATTFETEQGPRPFLSLKVRRDGHLRIITDPRAAECHFRTGIYAGLQNSVIRRRVFAGHRFAQDSRVVDDALFLARALIRGIRLAYLTEVHVIYRIHDQNSSGSSAAVSTDALRAICLEQIRGLERMPAEVEMTASQHRAWRACLAQHYFWRLGYACCWQSGDTAGALAAQERGLRLTPLDLRMWKTFLACRVRSLFRPGERPALS